MHDTHMFPCVHTPVLLTKAYVYKLCDVCVRFKVDYYLSFAYSAYHTKFSAYVFIVLLVKTLHGILVFACERACGRVCVCLMGGYYIEHALLHRRGISLYGFVC